ncbi:ABC transporter permease subunit [Solirubrobacter phytolaccae]|uniref:ABC transporter permease subunit n=1 Tax=Solirubrobacter phytolaccae TaxID=1404360 RepID=A0A9X3S7A7_9ACTN|nr:ABC transporter permease subunit [Solirubrobacter phytolaccae]MDA0180829.1 ABC transporter permease subunit [Solirubrobacter phytolaccae]
MSGVGIVAGFALRESVRRRVFVVVALLTVAFLGLYGLGVWRVSREVTEFGDFQAGVEPDTVAGATLLGLAMFATLFLGAILAVFLTLNAVRGDAERGLLQPIVVRPLGRATFLLGRYVAAAGVCVAYTVFVFLASVVITHLFIDWWPDRLLTPALQMGVAVAVLAALALGGSVLLSSTANGIAIFMLFGAGLTAGLLGQIGEALDSDTLQDVSQVTSWILPFEAHYQDALSEITADSSGFTRYAINLGPFGGAQEFGAFLWPYTVLYLSAIALVSLWAFRRRDL